MKHVTVEQLLGLRDGEPSTGVADHVAACERCSAELERLHQAAAVLRALPVRNPPRDRWPAVRAAALADRRRRRWTMAGWGSLALAASVALVITVGGRPDSAVAPMAGGDVEALIGYSRQLEDALRAMEPEGRVLNGRAASAVVELEDRIAVVDAQLALSRGGQRPDELMDLWRQRVALLDALVDVHVTRTAYVGF